MPKASFDAVSSQLRCTLCPKSPQFSDVSHLLTHVSSKSHLAHKFKLQIKAQSTPSAKQQLDDFDIWYHNNNLDHLLSERLAAKEQKKNTRTKRQTRPKAQSDVSLAPTRIQYFRKAHRQENKDIHFLKRSI
jgi:hypothetical protein